MTSYAFTRKVRLSLLCTILLLVGCAFVFSPALYAADEAVGPDAGQYTTAWVCIAAAIAFGMGALGAGMAISKVGSAAMGAISEEDGCQLAGSLNPPFRYFFMPLWDVASSACFSNQKLFNRTFKEIYGCTPSSVRKSK